MKQNFQIEKVLKTTKNLKVYLIKKDEKLFVLKTVTSFDAKTITMLKNEVKNLILLENFNIVPKVIEYNFDDENNYAILEYIEGNPIDKIKGFSFDEKLDSIFKVLDVIKKIHEMGIVHCDLKPSHIILTKNNDIKIIDFGISSYKDENLLRGYGNIQYCSLEQLFHENVTFSTDIYALGIIIYELLIGENIFGTEKEEIKKNKINSNYKRCDIPVLNMIMINILEANNNMKYKNIDELENALKILLEIGGDL